ncbi:MAG: methylated-DNA--[protein]-cysteine S-methyltransferase [Myxococcales bacterium]|nr:methylated-DNA--[protein]-cysteine S-methyltransferase [Myxococcales bacterium]
MVLPSALGPLRLVASREGLCGVYFPNHRGEPVELAGPAVRELGASGIPGASGAAGADEADGASGTAGAAGAAGADEANAETTLRAAAAQLTEYFAGERQRFELALAPTGTAFQLRVWQALRAIPFAATCSYGALATAIGNRNASRAVGAANGKNPISIIVPCHRVIGADGSLTGFGGGEPAKRWLLDHEARTVGQRLAGF